MEIIYRPAVSLHPTGRPPHFGLFLPVSPWVQIISLFLNFFQTLLAKTCRLKYFAILLLEYFAPSTNANHLKPPRNHPKLLAPTEPTTTPPRNELPNFTLFFCYWLWIWFLRKAELGKNSKDLAKIINYKGKLWSLSHSSERLL